jgi:TfoX/Sxy family transcriptional regulator of competence genes
VAELILPVVVEVELLLRLLAVVVQVVEEVVEAELLHNCCRKSANIHIKRSSI